MPTATTLNAQKSWMESTALGFGELSRGRMEEAAQCWLDADAVEWGARAFDPLRAASRTNAGAAHLLLGARREAQLCFDAAERSWLGVISNIATLDVPMTGASSSFHFRLAATGPEVLINARRERYRRLAEAALAVSQFNRAFAEGQDYAAAAVATRALALKLALSETLGEMSPEVRLLSACIEPNADVDVCAIYADKLADITVRRQTFAAALSESCAEFEYAAASTVLLALPILPTARHIGIAATDNANYQRHLLELE